MGVDSLWTGDSRIMAGSRPQALVGQLDVNKLSDFQKVRSGETGGPKTPGNTFKIVIPNTLHKDKRHLKNI